mmetsp:Transcript_10990/g.24530  ORF Transcript_10990/g.24530 Transcript_10990/m.24530 type:complete len:216 (+) Transcript_10990:511-1158(+)
MHDPVARISRAADKGRKRQSDTWRKPCVAHHLWIVRHPSPKVVAGQFVPKSASIPLPPIDTTEVVSASWRCTIRKLSAARVLVSVFDDEDRPRSSCSHNPRLGKFVQQHLLLLLLPSPLVHYCPPAAAAFWHPSVQPKCSNARIVLNRVVLVECATNSSKADSGSMIPWNRELSSCGPVESTPRVWSKPSGQTDPTRPKRHDNAPGVYTFECQHP